MNAVATFFSGEGAEEERKERLTFWWTLAAVLLSQWPVWRWFVARLDDGSDEPWGLLALLAALGLILLRRAEVRLSLLRWGSMVFLMLAQLFLPPATPALVSGVIAMVILGICCGTGRGSLPILTLLLLALPIVASLQFFAGYWLRLAASVGSAELLGLFGQEITVTGTMLNWRGEIIAVDPPCSGIRMLWFGGFLYSLSSAWHRVSAVRFLLGGVLAVGILIIANVLRATLLFYKESGLVSLPDSMHEGIGLIVFALAAFVLIKIPGIHLKANQQDRILSKQQIPFSCSMLLLLIAVPGPLLRSDGENVQPVESQAEINWPISEQGIALIEIPIPEDQRAFLRTFPGAICAFTWGNEIRIYRWVQQPTRQVHPASDCYRASGWRVTPEAQIRESDGRRWSVTRVDRGSQRLEILEQIRDRSDGYWTEPSQWYWEAVLGRTSGPWWVITRVRTSF